MSQFPRLDVLPAAQRSLWPKLSDVCQHGFVLYGGTAVALYLGHRESVDFDFFSNRPFRADELFGSYAFLSGAEVLQAQPNTLTVLTTGTDQNRVKLSFFGGLRFGRLAPPRRAPGAAVRIASLADLLAHELKTVLQRVELKDYVDVDALLRNRLSLSSGLAGAQLLFSEFSPQECLKALTYFDDDALRDLPDDLQQRLVAAVTMVSSVPAVRLDSETLND